ncbi:PREDICTED: pyroglutamylated RFamide peptide receptor isoform X1 [Sturnus vulgaris]|uniref:pyroglutamylated RFamide peptide receptor isoform X1 n=2 Tax=Sturnus vulgaris TaxID=9172 RepID=UPI00071A5105|nr:PREDICTED: pyroglutamylated RFamide peptide receptor isoform X1 [Sturnus vulgaris]
MMSLLLLFQLRGWIMLKENYSFCKSYIYLLHVEQALGSLLKREPDDIVLRWETAPKKSAISSHHGIIKTVFAMDLHPLREGCQHLEDWSSTGAFACKMVPFVQSTAIVTEILTMTCIAVERHQGIVHPLKMKWQYTNKRAFTMLGIVWLLALIVGSPMWYVQRLEVKYDFLYEKVHVCCLEEWASPIYQKIYTTFILVILFLLPLMLMLFLYTKIGYELWIKKRVGDASVLQTIHGSEMSKISRKKKRAIVMMVTVVFLFAVCWAPFHVIHMMMEYSNFEKEYDDVTIKMIFAIVQIIGFFNSICNPIVYAFMNENFKKNFLSALCFCIMKENTSPGRQLGNSGMTMRRKKPSASQRDPTDSDGGRREAFSDGNIEVKFCDQPASKRNLRKHLVLFSSELTVHSAVGNGQ